MESEVCEVGGGVDGLWGEFAEIPVGEKAENSIWLMANGRWLNGEGR